MSEFRQDLLNTVRMRADVDGDFTLTSFVNEVSERLADAEEIENLVPTHFSTLR